MRTLKENPIYKKKGTSKKTAEPQLKQQIAKLIQKNNAQVNTTLPFFQSSKTSSKPFGGVCAFAANTNVGTVRKGNEDRIAIILNVIQPPQKIVRTKNWPKV